MTINFTQIFQDSWNFVRNQRQIAISFMAAFFILALATQFILSQMAPAIMENLQTAPINNDLPPEAMSVFSTMLHPNVLTISLINQIISSLLSTWGIITLHHITQHRFRSLSDSFSQALRYFIGVLALNVLITIPLAYGLIVLLTGSILGLVVAIIGIYLFLRLCLAPLAYIIGQKSFTQSLKFVWQQSSGRISILLIYCLINYLLVSMLSNQLAAFNNNLIIQIITTAISSFISVFALVFSYRFYHLFIQTP
ncbi:hypothetical protein [Conservatibacter flavescens]|uniref:Uncharacterized protein n=1 Tax=Conservatibacter flavescens TaxID=28161 RepID=A0A2M8S0Y7_9PAST|nr:hypothetical protein [Conservatibacter flavescens]PJG84766.1 hypothetical protein CVP05_09495 [Conservatibacter flavescens]